MPFGIGPPYDPELDRIASGLQKGTMMVRTVSTVDRFGVTYREVVVEELQPNTAGVVGPDEMRALDLIDKVRHNRGVSITRLDTDIEYPYTISTLGANTTTKLPQPGKVVTHTLGFEDASALWLFPANTMPYSSVPQMRQFQYDSPTYDFVVADKGESTELIVGYRDFKLAEYDWNLQSRNGALWMGREKLVAMCGEDPFVAHDAPAANCECGIYAYSTPNDIHLRKDANVWGEVYLWGRVLICTKGYRAEYAYPKTIFIRDVGTKLNKYLAEQLEELYGVPVFRVKERTGQTTAEVFAEMVSRELGGGETNNTDD